MRYLENKDRSAELLRLILPLMAKQSAAFHPLSYTLWYEHAAGLNPELSAQLLPHLDAGPPLTEEDVSRLHTLYVLDRDAQSIARLQAQLQTLLSEIARSTVAAGTEASDFSRNLEACKAELVAGEGEGGLERVVASLMSMTSEMQTATNALSRQLEASAKQVDSLTDQLGRAQSEALVDPLTGLNNRRGLEKVILQSFGTEPDFNGSALLMLDIDHFKRVNDTYGHLLGDKVIRAVAQVLHENIKGRDIAARLGGEEFAVLLPATNLQGGMAVAEQVRACVARGRIHREGAQPIGSITISIGVAAGEQAEPLEGLIQRADEALYAAKRAGRNRVQVIRAGEKLESPKP